jgi:hypothetical protein
MDLYFHFHIRLHGVVFSEALVTTLPLPKKSSVPWLGYCWLKSEPPTFTEECQQSMVTVFCHNEV